MIPNPTIAEDRVVSLFKILALLGLAGVVLWFAYEVRSLIPPFLVALIVAMTLIPEVDKIEYRGVPRSVAIGVIYVAFLAVFALMLVGLNQLVNGQVAGMVASLIRNAMPHGTTDDIEVELTAWMGRHHVWQLLQKQVINEVELIPTALDAGLSMIVSWAENLAWLIVMPVIVFFILLDFHPMVAKLVTLAPEKQQNDILTMVTSVIEIFGNYVRGMVIVMLLDIAATYFVLLLSHVGGYSLSLAVLSGVLFTIPYVGSFVGTAIVGAAALVLHGSATAGWVTLTMVILHQVIFNNIVAPRVIGGSVNLNPVMTLFALMAGGALFGFGGILLAVPIAAAIQVVLVQLFPRLKGDDPASRRVEREIRSRLAHKTIPDASGPALTFLRRIRRRI